MIAVLTKTQFSSLYWDCDRDRNLHKMTCLLLFIRTVIMIAILTKTHLSNLYWVCDNDCSPSKIP